MTDDEPGLPAETIQFDFRDPAYGQNPYPILAMLRRQAPVYQSPFGFWLMTRYEDVNALNRDPRLGRDLRQWHGYTFLRPYLAESNLERCVEQWMFSLDPPAHTRIRQFFARAFTPKVVEQLRPRITTIAQNLLDELDDTTPFNFMQAFAQPFPVRVITELLDLPQMDYTQLKAWSDALACVVEPAPSKKQKLAADAAASDMSTYLQEFLADYHIEDSFVGRLLASTASDGLTLPELIANLLFLFVAGHETTTNWLGNGLLALLQHPEQLARLRQEPSLLKTAVEEMLRYDSPVNVNARAVHEDIFVGGQTIAAGSLIFCMLGAANRDPEMFTNPDQFDISRQPNPHVSFGGGPHFCLGAPLARVEAQIAFEQILQCWSVIELDESGVSWRNLVNLRGLETVPLWVDKSQ